MRKLTKRIILAGKAGSGKDFLRDVFTERGFEPDISVTTRPMRDGEEAGKTYHFISEEQYQDLERGDALYESIRYVGKAYGTLRVSWESSDVFIMTPTGVSQIHPEDRDDCYVIYLDIPMDVRRGRLQKRSDWDSVNRRIEADEKDFKHFKDFDARITDPLFDPDFVISEMMELHGKATETI